jgi:CoA:oxalate CoA-transferase
MLLKGVRVLDLTNVLAGPFCAYQLALLGADVIKVETPGTGDLARQLGASPELSSELMGASFLAQNANKKSVTINLKTDAGKQAFSRLARTADVLVENFRPGVMERLGLAYDDLKAINSKLIYCAISGFGQQGPMRGAPAYDQIIQGLSGVMSITGSQDSAPLRVGYPVCDSIGGITAAFAIASALVKQRSTGEGCFIDVSMLDSTLATMGWVVSNYLIAGQQPVPMGNDNFTAAPSGAFRTGDGLLNIAANKQEQFAALMKVIGREDLVDDPRFGHREDRKRHRDELTAELEAALAQRSASEWETLLNGVGVPAGRVLSVPDALALEQVQGRTLVEQLDDFDVLGKPLSLITAGYRLGADEQRLRTPPPRLGEHTDEILGSVGYSAGEIAALREVAAI